MIRWRARSLPLVWKLLIPFLILLLLVGGLGTFVLVRDLATRAQTSLDNDLAQRSLAARSIVHDRELYLLESATFASNVQGMSAAVKARDRVAVNRLLASVLALKTDLTLVAISDIAGSGVAEYSRSKPGGPATEDPPASWSGSDIVGPVAGGQRRTGAGLLGFGEHQLVAIATPICAGVDPCDPVGTALVAVDAAQVIADAEPKTSAGTGIGLALYDPQGRRVASSAHATTAATIPTQFRTGFVRQETGAGAGQFATLYSPLELQGRPAATLAITLPTAPAFASVRDATAQLVLVLLVAMLGTVAVGGVVSRLLLRQVGALVATNRTLAAGDLTARAPVMGDDELGELARGLNTMAAEVQASHETLEARVDERTAEVQRLLRERTDFFTAISHEFRTPLAVILAQAAMLADPRFRKTRDWQAQSGETVAESARQLLAFVNDIMELARAEAGRMELHLREVDLGKTADALRPAIESLASASGLTSEVLVEDDLPLVNADEGRLRQVVINLVDNAVKYTPAGGNVRLALGHQNGTVGISVSDTGVGIPAEAARHLFKPFYRVKTTQPQNGQASSGLGLAIAKRLVDAHGGQISFESEPGRGTTFTVELPSAASSGNAVSPVVHSLSAQAL